LKQEINNNETASRRGFLKNIAASVVAAGALVPAGLSAKDDPALIEEPKWGSKLGLPVDKNLYGMPSPYEHNVTRRVHKLLSSGDMYASVAMCPIQDLDGIITPNGLFFNRAHGGVAIVDPNEYRLIIHGLVEKPLFMKGMMSQAEWTGVKLSTLLKDVGVKPTAKWVLAEGSDDSHMGRTIPIEKILDDAMLVWAQNGEALRPEQGYPVRLLVPGWEGNLNVKWLKRLKFGDKPWHSKEETSKYTMLTPTGKAIQFFWPMEVNSVITNPCPDKPWTDLKKGDIVEIQGLAWSGEGTIKGVDITFDGGKNWVEANLKGLVLPKAWTRFSYIYKWDGKPIVLGSRAYDDAGFVQPTITEEVSRVGVEGIYHRNAIVTWEVKANGEVHNVQVRDYKKERESIHKLQKGAKNA